MAPYTPDRRRKNQIEVLAFTAMLLFATPVAYGLGAAPVGASRLGTDGPIAAAVGIVAVGSVLWWLFGSKRAGDTRALRRDL